MYRDIHNVDVDLCDVHHNLTNIWCHMKLLIAINENTKMPRKHDRKISEKSKIEIIAWEEQSEQRWEMSSARRKVDGNLRSIFVRPLSTVSSTWWSITGNMECIRPASSVVGDSLSVRLCYVPKAIWVFMKFKYVCAIFYELKNILIHTELSSPERLMCRYFVAWNVSARSSSEGKSEIKL